MKRIIPQVLPWFVPIFVISLALWIAKPVYGLGFIKFQGNNTVNATAKWITLCGLLFFFFIIWIIKTIPNLQQELSTQVDPVGLRRIVIISASSILICIAVFNIFADSWDLYGLDFWESRVLPSRSVKLDFYSRLAEPPEMVIVGTSAAFRIAPAYIQEKLGIRAFNWAINGGKAPEIRILLEYLAQQHPGEYPEVLLMQVSEQSAEAGYHQLPFSLLPFLSPWTLIQEGGLRLSEAINLSQLSDSLYVFRYTLSPSTRPLANFYCLEDGFSDRIIKRFSETAVLEQTEKVANCSSASEVYGKDIEEIIAFTEEQNSSIVFYISPFLPEFYDKYMKNDPDYRRCHQEIKEYFTELALQHDNVFFEDYTLLDSIDGLDGEEGFYDAGHLTPQNSERLIDALSDTIRQAYAAAEARRNAATEGGK